ncbi:MAG: energy-coupling factor ABC transporter permease [Cardiobacteriaceae bacterium]|nr:energy-coupling factor ABC transporter permease [Cardiobacteriaceae bacterium]
MQLSLNTVIITGLLWLVFFATVAYRARRQLSRLQPIAIHLFCGTILTLTTLAFIRTAAVPGLDFYLLGLTATTLLMGWKLAILAATFSQVLQLILGIQEPTLIGIHGLTHIIVPIAISTLFSRLLQRYLPSNPFIYTLGAGFFGGILSLAATMLITALLLWIIAAYPWDTLWHKYLKFMLIIIYPEGFINGLFITSMVAFHPHLLTSFDPEHYFTDRHS